MADKGDHAARSPGERIHYRFMRQGIARMAWEAETPRLREAMEEIALARPDLVPSEEYLAERDAEMKAKMQ